MVTICERPSRGRGRTISGRESTGIRSPQTRRRVSEDASMIRTVASPTSPIGRLMRPIGLLALVPTSVHVAAAQQQPRQQGNAPTPRVGYHSLSELLAKLPDIAEPAF